MKTWYLIVIILLASCSPAAKLRKAKRLIHEAEASGLEWKSDTVFREVTVTVPETRFDTVLKEVNFLDTLIVTKEKVVTRVKVDTVEKTVYVDTKCPEKTVIKKVPYVVNRDIKVGDSLWTNLKQGFLWFLIGAAACWILKFSRLSRKSDDFFRFLF